ncbi:MAG: hypothetical protein AD742_11910 [Methylibium sp. NZG]|nr:MAG: hypothetical protein AD742_11910 [Methylibium sp. NZG]
MMTSTPVRQRWARAAADVQAQAQAQAAACTPARASAITPSPSMWAFVTGLLAACLAVPAAAQTACYVRAETPAAASAPGDARVAQSHVGLRRKNDKLFELDIAVTGSNAAVCNVGGVARLSGDAGKEALAMVVRPDPLRSKGVRSGALCHVYVHLTATAVELRTTREACKAQALCEGKVELNGQRFDATSRLPDGVSAPCFERRVL